MTRLLASVTDPGEAEIALRAGADIIDLKDPGRGALGALAPGTIRAIVEQVAGRRPVSATVGDLPPDPPKLEDAIRRTAATGVDYVKVGFFGIAGLAACLDAIAGLTPDQNIVAVLFADRYPPLEDLSPFAAAGLAGVMLDTADKAGGRLLAHARPGTLAAFVAQSRSLGLLSGLAGSLSREDIPLLLPLAPDYLGFRGALCRGRERTQCLDPQRLRRVRAAIAPGTARVA